MKVVIDTNVLISGILFDGNESEVLDLIDQKRIKLIVSEEILNEYKRVLLYKKFQLTKEEVETILSRVIQISEFVIPIKKLSIVRDSSDNKFVECAVEGDTMFIISGDKHLLELKTFDGIKILNAKEFLSKLSS